MADSVDPDQTDTFVRKAGVPNIETTALDKSGIR